MLELFYIYRFYFTHVVMIWEGQIDQIGDDQLAALKKYWIYYFF